MEIERKFKVKSLPQNLEQYRRIEMSQAYISAKPTIRIRQENDKFFLTIKGRGDIAREEYQLEISKDEFEGLLPKAETKFLRKTRYIIPLQNGLKAELDIYKAEFAPLKTVEVEFETEEQAKNFTPPEWFGEDVSLDYRYKNSNLCAVGLPE